MQGYYETSSGTRVWPIFRYQRSSTVKGLSAPICLIANGANSRYQSPAGDWRADVCATRGERGVVFEIRLSKISQEELQEREEKYARDGIESYWLLT